MVQGMKKTKNIKGQALLIVLLVMAVILTVVLSSVSRTVTNVAITGLEEDALRAFSAAEAGVEQSLLDQTVGSFGPTPIDTQNTQVTYSRVVSEPSVVSGAFEYPKALVSGETATFFLVSHSSNGSLTCGGGVPCFSGPATNQIRFCWGAGNSEAAIPFSARPAIEVMFYYDPVGASPKSIATPNNYLDARVARVAFDYNAAARGNGFTSAGVTNNGQCSISGRTYIYQSAVAIPSSLDACKATRGCLLAAKVRMYYNTTAVPVAMYTTSGNFLPPQGIQIESTGVSGESTRKVNVFQLYPEIPDIFDGAIFSSSSLSK